MESYPEWVQLVADLTIKSLNSWQWASASIFYLMGLWSRLVSSMPYLKGDAPSFMQTYVPKIARAYVTSRQAIHAANQHPLQLAAKPVVEGMGRFCHIAFMLGSLEAIGQLVSAMMCNTRMSGPCASCFHWTAGSAVAPGPCMLSTDVLR